MLASGYQYQKIKVYNAGETDIKTDTIEAETIKTDELTVNDTLDVVYDEDSKIVKFDRYINIRDTSFICCNADLYFDYHTSSGGWSPILAHAVITAVGNFHDLDGLIYISCSFDLPKVSSDQPAQHSDQGLALEVVRIPVNSGSMLDGQEFACPHDGTGNFKGVSSLEFTKIGSNALQSRLISLCARPKTDHSLFMFHYYRIYQISIDGGLYGFYVSGVHHFNFINVPLRAVELG